MNPEKKTLQNIFPSIIIGTMRLGAWGKNMNAAQREKFIDACIDMGMTHFDHADIYGHYTEETAFGDILKKRPDLKNKIQITTKCGIKLISENRPSHKIKSYDCSAAHIVQSVEHSLNSLCIERIDMLLLHRYDHLLEAEEIAHAFDQLKTQGKVLNFGVSNFSVAQLEYLNNCFPLVNHQFETSLFNRDAFHNGLIQSSMKLGIIPTAWSPLGGGSFFNDDSNLGFTKIRHVIDELNKKYQSTADQILLAWLYKHPAGIIPVIGTTNIDRIKAAVNAKQIKLTHEEWYQLLEAASGREVD